MTPRPDLLRRADWRAAAALSADLADAGAAGFQTCALQRLPGLLPAELVTLSLCDLRVGRREVCSLRPAAIGPAERAAFDRHFDEHPLVRYHARQRGPYAHRISDSMDRRSFRASALYADYYRRVGLDHAMAVPLFADARWLVSVVLNRAGRDFSDRELALADALRPPLALAWRGARAAEASELGDGLAAALTPREREVLRWVAAGKTDRDIGQLLGCSHRTVHKHLQRSYAKLGVETRTAAAMRWLGR